jgi:hypothetical protein
MRLQPLLLLIAAPSLGAAQLLPSPTPERCVAAPAGLSAAALIDSAVARVMPATDGRILRYRAFQDVPFWEQSDRMYPPFVPNIQATTRWLDVSAGTEGRQAIDRPIQPGRYPGLLFTATTAYSGRDTLVRAVPGGPVDVVRRENPWSVLADWRSHAAATRVVNRCLYRDAWRIVLERDGERLYLSESDATPVKVERRESHYLWGDVKAEYVWSTWWGVAGAPGAQYPLATFRILDGEVYERIGIQMGSTVLIPSDSAPRLNVAGVMTAGAPAGGGGLGNPAFSSPDTVRVAANTYLLVTPAYTQTVTLQRDTVFLLDATTSEARARGDSAMIATLFPGKHPVVVVVTDLAWPHISGVRFWVARGATIVSHRASEDFLRRVVNRKWTLSPDALERSRATARFRFRAVDDSLTLGGGALVVHALQGSSTETALGVWMPAIRYFWAGDYIQGGGTSPYQRDVVRTIRSLGLTPDKVGAQHIKLTNWSELEGRR